MSVLDPVPNPVPKDYDVFKPQLIVLWVQHFKLHGQILTANQASEKYEVPVELAEYALQDKGFLAALDEQGIVIRDNDWATKYSLTPIQITAADSILDLADTRSQKKKLQDINVTTQQWETWLKDPVFADYMKTRAENILKEHGHVANLALMDKVQQGDIKAIEYLNEMTGKYIRPRSNSYGINGMDVMNIIESIIEIIDLRVLDVDIKLLIAEDIKSLIARKQLATGLVEASLPVGNEPKALI